MERVAVTGGAGFVGCNLVSRLISEGYSVKVIDDFSTGLRSNLDEKSCTIFDQSIVDLYGLRRAIGDCEVIFHLAARGSVPRSVKHPIATHEVNATGTLNVLEVARESGAHVVFSSSSSVYGRNSCLPKDEDMWLGPMTPYAASKMAAEGYLQAYSSAYNIKATSLRFFNVFGPGQRPDHEYAAVLPKWIWLAIQGKPIDVYGDGSVSRDFTYIETVLDIAITTIKEKIAYDGVINLAYGNRIYLMDVINMLMEHFPRLEVNYKESRLGDVKESQNSPLLLKSLFPGITPKPFKEALFETIKWFEDFGHRVANGPKTLN